MSTYIRESFEHPVCTFFFFCRIKIPTYKATKNLKGGQKLVIDKSTSVIRPHCVAAVLRNVTFNKER